MEKILRVLIQVVFYIQLCQPQREGARCVDRYTSTVRLCRRADQCKSAREDFQFNGIQPTFCSTSGDTPVVCCRDEASSILQVAPHNPPLTRPFRDEAPVWGQAGGSAGGEDAATAQARNDSRRVSERKCEEYSRRVTQSVDFISLLPDPEVMSVSSSKCNYDSTPLIVGGQDAELNEFPHMAAIGWPLARGSYAMKCGGSLISPRFVLTAGHCLSVGADTSVTSAEPAVVRLGEHNLDPDVYDGAEPIEIAIRRLHRHPAYHPPRRYNDIGLLELASDAELSGAVRPACLWSGGGFGGRRKAIATGWGVTDTRTQRASDVLQKVSLNLLDSGECDRLLAGLRNRHWGGFDATQLCAGVLSGGMDSCQGDSGGPLQVASEHNQCVFRVLGVTSFGGACAAVGRPAVYTRVAAYLDWIESVVWPQG